MCHLEDVYHAACGCWRTSPRVSTPCAVGRATPYYRNYGCHSSRVTGSVRLESICPRCENGSTFSSAASSAAASRRGSAITLETSSRKSSVATNVSVFSQNTGSFEANGEPKMEARVYQRRGAMSSMNLQSLDAALETVAEKREKKSRLLQRVPSARRGAIQFNERIFDDNGAVSASFMAQTEGEKQMEAEEDEEVSEKAWVEEAKKEVALGVAEMMLQKIQIRCSGRSVEQARQRRRASEWNAAMHGMRERRLS